jgi:hypothetical protein
LAALAIAAALLGDAAAADVTEYAAARYVGYTQTSDAAPTVPETWFFRALVASEVNNEVVLASVSFDAPPVVTHNFIEAIPTLYYFDSVYYTNQAQFIQDYPATSYTVTVDRGFGPETGDVFLPEDLFCPETPAFTGDTYSRLQNCDAAVAFDGDINGFTLAPGANSGWSSVTLVRVGDPGALWSVELPPSATAFHIPAGLLQPATDYSIGITYFNQVLTPGAGFGGAAASGAEFYRGTGALFTTRPETPAVDIQYYQISKLSSYTQTSVAPPATPDFWRFAGLLFYVPEDGVTSASITFDAPPLTTVDMVHTPNLHLYYSPDFASQAALDEAYPSTMYTFTADRGAGPESADVFLPVDLFSPETPYLTGNTYNRLQNYDASQPFDLHINGFTLPAGANAGQSNVQIADPTVGLVFSASMAPEQTSVHIPAGLLDPSTSYDISVQYFVSIDTPNAGFGAATSAASFIRDTNGTFTTRPRCAADFNGSGAVSVQDIFDFLAAYFSQDPRADFNHSGLISVQDIFDFLAAYFAGC